jgi:dihydrofolate synthase/folylpolyglutamate synthase
VAGTNGKGSTCRFLHRILQGAGLRTGLFTSPHLVCVRERFVLDEEAVGEAEFSELVGIVLPHAQASGATYFETLTAVAALWYRRHDVQALVLETGLGGRLDSTTAFPAEVCAVAQVGLDHTSILGGTVEKIWAEKIAILRPGKPLVTLERRTSLLEPLHRLARERDGWAVLPDPEDAVRFPGLPPGSAQPENLLLARRCAELFLERAVTDDEIRRALADMRWPGRQERVHGDPELVLDVGHNPDAAREIARSLDGVRPVVLYGTMADKDWRQVFGILSGFAHQIHLAPLPVARAATTATLHEAFPSAIAHDGFDAAWTASREAARKFGVPLLVFGSFHLVGAVLRRLSADGLYDFWPCGVVPDPELPGQG